jgi:hypothetical protein
LKGLRLGLRLRLKPRLRLGLKCMRLCFVKGLSLWLGLQAGQRKHQQGQ